MKKIDQFIIQLSRQQFKEGTTNLYRGRSKGAIIRRENLRRYLYKMYDLKPTHLLLGEAPGYKGCVVTGIAFSSERIISQLDFFMDQGFECVNCHPNLETESSATIVWNELSMYNNMPLIWNIFPFHPYKHQNRRSNRTPTKAELEIGKKYLGKILDIFSIRKIIALGRKPESQLKNLCHKYVYVRHPANGGKFEFLVGLQREMI